MKRKITRNAARCNYCGDVIESTYTHDFRTCSCGRVSVDGGHDYLCRSYASSDCYTDLSETVEDPMERPTQGIEDADPEEADEILRQIQMLKKSDLKITQTKRFEVEADE